MRDIDIRRALRTEMRRVHSGEPDTLIVEELGLCQGAVRVDLAVVNGTIHGFEIKSDQDTLARLPVQSDVYSRTFDYVTLITAPAHMRKAKAIVPKWWGVWTATERDGRVSLKETRRPRPNPVADSYLLAQLLWRDETLQLLEERGLAKGVRSKPRDVLWRRLATAFSAAELGAAVREVFKCRGPGWRAPASPT